MAWEKLEAMKLLMCSAMIGAALFAATPLAHADEDPNANPPNCSAADLEFVRAGVQQATAAVLRRPPRREQFLQQSRRAHPRPDEAEGTDLHEVAPADEGRARGYPGAAGGYQEPLRQPRTSAALETVGDHAAVHHAVTLHVGVVGTVHARSGCPTSPRRPAPLVTVDVVVAGGVIEQKCDGVAALLR